MAKIALKQPKNLEDAIKILKSKYNKPTDIQEIKKADPAQLHFGFGMFLRNYWKLWEKGTPIVKWFKKKYGVEHPDDLSGLILSAWIHDVKGEPRETKELIEKYKLHWENYGK